MQNIVVDYISNFILPTTYFNPSVTFTIVCIKSFLSNLLSYTQTFYVCIELVHLFLKLAFYKHQIYTYAIYLRKHSFILLSALIILNYQKARNIVTFTSLHDTKNAFEWNCFMLFK